MFIQLSEQGTGNGQEEADLEQALPAQVFISALFLQLQQHRRSKLSWTFSPCPALTKRRCLLLGPNWRSHVLFFFFFLPSFSFVHYEESYTMRILHRGTCLLFVCKVSTEKCVQSTADIFPLSSKTRPPFVVLFFSLEQMGSCRSAISDTKSAELASSQKSCRRKTSYLS